MGFINLEKSDSLNYPDTKAGLSVFHQLHCLVRTTMDLSSESHTDMQKGALRHFMWDLVYGRYDTEKLLREWPQNVTAPTYHGAIHGLWHIAHCFDYLRQGVQCSADMSLEFVSENTGLAVVDGLDYSHECKSWDAVWEYARKYG